MCYKNGYLDLEDSAESTLYIKVPMRNSNDDLRFGHDDVQEREEDEPDPDTLGPCVSDLIEAQYNIRSSREKRLMGLLNMPGKNNFTVSKYTPLSFRDSEDLIY